MSVDMFDTACLFVPVQKVSGKIIWQMTSDALHGSQVADMCELVGGCRRLRNCIMQC